MVDAFFYWRRNNAPERAAALSFYTLSSVAPTLLIAVSIGRLLITPGLVTGELERQAAITLGNENARLLVGLAQTEFDTQAKSLTLFLSLLLLFFSATGLFRYLRFSLNAYLQLNSKEADRKKRSSLGIRLLQALKNELFVRVIAVFMVILAALMIVVSLSLFTFLNWGARNISPNLSFNPGSYRFLNTIVSFILFTIIFSLIFYYVPRTRHRLLAVILGAATGSFLFNILQYLFGLYLSVSSVGSAFGTAGSLVVFLLWMYYSTQSMYFGAGMMAVLEGKMDET